MWGQGNFHHNFSQGLIKCFSFKFYIYMGENPILFTHILDIVQVKQPYLGVFPGRAVLSIFSTQDLDGRKSIKA